MSKWFSKIKTWYDKGLWTVEMVHNAVPKMITAQEFELITGIPYEVNP